MDRFFNWISGFVISTICAWVISLFFVDTNITYQWDKEINNWVFSEGSILKCQSEGRGQTYIGKHGIHAVEDIKKNTGRKVAIWGDSYVEALQVDDREKTDQIVTRLCKENGINDLTAFAIGYSGSNIADYYFNIPRYERVIPSIICHVILVTHIEYILPDEPGIGAEFRSIPAYALIEKKVNKPYQEILQYFQKYDFSFLWYILRSAKHSDLQFFPGHNYTEKKEPVVRRTIPSKETWDFLFSKYTSQTNIPIIFVYCPTVPRIKHGCISFEDPNHDMMSLFALECEKFNIGFIDMTNDFSDNYNQNKTFPRGFNNSRIGEGHFNQAGHKLVAQAIFRYLKENKME